MNQKQRELYILEGINIVKKRVSLFIYKHKLFAFMSNDDIEDLEQDCVVVMIQTVDRFDTGRGVKLVTFLVPRIDGFLKDFVKKQVKEHQMLDMDKVLSIISMRLDKVLRTTTKHAVVDLEQLDISETEMKELVLDMGYHPDSFEIFDSLINLPETRLKVILGYYVLNKTIKELSEELGFSPDTGWVYRLKNEGIKTLKEMLKEKGLL